ncbi:SET and MYND domain-containing protein 4 [Halotydeus destructor]|nr:SET and MYND domain-containing protein 4 [Halotydeus destructor]
MGCTVNPSVGKVYVDIGIAFLPLQVVLLHGIENVIRDCTENKQCTHICKAGSNYASLLTLCTHEEKYSSQENVNFALTAIFLVTVMNQIHPLEGEQLLICAEVLLKHIQQLSTNSISVVQQNLVQGLSNQSAEEDVGVAIYPNISFLNHSCQPNVVPIFEGSKLTLQASRTIKMGEEISFCYGPSVATMTSKDRMAHLKKQYFFDCSCYACENAIESQDNALLCPSCSGPMVYNLDFTSNCLNCKYEEQDVSEIVNRSSKLNLIAAEGAALMEKDDLEEAISKISQAHNEMDKLLHRHNLQLIQVKENLCKCLALMGHYEMAYKYSMFNLRTQEIINGPESMQVAFELQKACKLRWNFIEELVEDSDSQRALEHANGLLLLLERLLSLFTKLNESLKENSQIIDSDLGFTNQIVNLTDIKSKVLSLIESL